MTNTQRYDTLEGAAYGWDQWTDEKALEPTVVVESAQGSSIVRFSDRAEAGILLADRLEQFAGRPDVLVLGLSNGGVPIATEIAQALCLPMDVLVVRTLGLPWNREYPVGAITAGGPMVVNESLMSELGLTRENLEVVIRDETKELWRRDTVFREHRPFHTVAGRTVILVDDELSNGAAMDASVRTARARGAREVIVAVPVASRDAVARFRGVTDQVVCLMMPEPFIAAGLWYEDFSALPDADVLDLLIPPASTVKW